MGETLEKVNTDGCFVDEATFIKLWKRVCDLQEREVKLWSGNFNEPDFHENDQPINIDEERADAGWAKVGTNGMQFTGSPDHVDIIGALNTDSTGNYWANPTVVVFRNGTDRIGAATSLHMDTNGTYSGESTASISFVDHDPGTDPIYTFRSFEKDNRTMNDATTVDISPITLKAHCKSITDTSGSTTSGPVLGAPANGALVSDNFQDGNGNAPFNLQVRLNGAGPTNWQAVVTGPYATIPNLVAGAYTLATNDNGDGTYTHVFTGTTPLTNFGGITITGDAPTPAGQGGTANVGLYIP